MRRRPEVSVTADGPAVEDLSAAVYVIPTDAPEADGTLAWNETTLVLVTARAGAELGIGWSYAAAAAADVVTDVLASVVGGRSALDVAGAAEAMARAVRNIGREGIAATAISAVDIALWDLKARLLGLPLASLLGRARDDVPVYGSGGFTSYDTSRTREQLSGWVEQDRIPRVKIKIGESWGSNTRRDLERVALAREVIGPQTELYVDANGGYTTGQAVRVADQMARRALPTQVTHADLRHRQRESAPPTDPADQEIPPPGGMTDENRNRPDLTGHRGNIHVRHHRPPQFPESAGRRRGPDGDRRRRAVPAQAQAGLAAAPDGLAHPRDRRGRRHRGRAAYAAVRHAQPGGGAG
jgi:hypothetical protein